MRAEEMITRFSVQGKVVSLEPYGSGHINETYRVVMEDGKKYILQRINTTIFTKPAELMENICGVTEYLRKKIIARGGEPERETLNIVPTKEGKSYLEAEDETCWRVYRFIEGATCYDEVKTPQDFYHSALAFGKFQAELADYPAHTLHETIPDFHNTAKRFRDFERAVQEDKMGLAAGVQEEISFARERAGETDVLGEMLRRGELPLRVTHNDTKLNNIMIDDATGEGICVIDLDTVMPGLAVLDFGDSIRFGANTAAEDEPDVSKVSLDLELYEIYVKGFTEGCAGRLTEKELEMLPMGAKMMTYECGIRFLADYLEGDVYFKVHRPGHNLDRCRTQFALIADMERKWDKMHEIVKKYS